MKTIAAMFVLLTMLPFRLAEASDKNAPIAPKHKSQVSAMFSPVRLFLPLAEATIEYQILERVSVAGIIGVGRRSVNSGSDSLDSTEIEIGAQARYYLWGGFRHGLIVGGELLYDYFKFDTPFPSGVVSAAAGGTHLAPFLGYKFVATRGFTIDLQAGVRFIALAPTPSGPGPHPKIENFSETLPLININLGWTF